MTDTRPKNEIKSGTIWEKLPTQQEEPGPYDRLQHIVYGVLLLLGLVALIAIAASMYRFTNYIRSAEAVRDLELEIVSLQTVDDANPRVDIHFRLHNRSSLELSFHNYIFALFLNGERVSSSSSTYVGTDPNTDPNIYKKATKINKVLGPGQLLDLRFTLYIFSAPMDIVRRAQLSDSLSWSIDASFEATLPYAAKVDLIPLSAGFEE